MNFLKHKYFLLGKVRNSCSFETEDGNKKMRVIVHNLKNVFGYLSQ